MLKVFIVDPSLVREALLNGRTLIVEVSERHHKVVLGPLSVTGTHIFPQALRMGARLR
jgi:hypothetical protein